MCATLSRSDNCRMCIRVEAEPPPEDAQPEDAQPEDSVPAGESGESGGSANDGPTAPEQEEDDEYEPLWQGFGEEIG
jgi:hypothetical protein